MSGDSSLLVEKLWRLKRRIDKGACPGVEFVHLNTLLREPGYRADVLRRVEQSGTEELKALAREIQANDTGQPLMADSSTTRITTPAEDTRKKSGWLRRRGLILVPALAIGAVAAGFTAFENRAVRIDTDISHDTIWETGRRYILEKTVYVENANLTIEPGVTIEGKNGSALVVTSTAKLFARGKADSPIVFTSALSEGKRARGDWGGVVLLGRAPVNEAEAAIEGLPPGETRGVFGGSDTDYSCGVIEYTRIEFAGFEVYKDNELNGLTLGGCGKNTIVRNVQVHRSLDDGIEMFGGNVDLQNIVISGAGDDSIDWDWGWTGRVQFAVIQQHPDAGDNAFEGDNNGGNHEATPRSEPTFYNITLVGAGNSQKKHRGMIVREGSGGHFHNMLIDSYGIEALDTRDDALSLVNRNLLTFSNNLMANLGHLGQVASETSENDDDFGFDEQAWMAAPGNNNVFRVDTALFPNAKDLVNPNFMPRIQLRQMNATRPPQSEFFDESANFVGAVSPVSGSSWLDGWTDFPES
ncbi:hypothetical protein FWJ25_01540 [Marinobacter salinexigens]|uniref:Right handed beta helix domain-containing protein n=1 Tax=Marinobacter salinexigens TaxID=2919747 RepID=A0A5B0VNB0_9GAMM|nr:hypothetical protein [Marinobacter salinexigens]KAA1175844.1 hypothetical protein FWJ25_01540 [Marinobacter salinexigens]